MNRNGTETVSRNSNFFSFDDILNNFKLLFYTLEKIFKLLRF